MQTFMDIFSFVVLVMAGVFMTCAIYRIVREYLDAKYNTQKIAVSMMKYHKDEEGRGVGFCPFAGKDEDVDCSQCRCRIERKLAGGEKSLGYRCGLVNF